jgi:hypothetical protein
MCVADEVWNTELTLINKNIRSHAQELTLILKIIGQTHFDVTDINNNASFEYLDIHYH